jgi:hypothetical protein
MDYHEALDEGHNLASLTGWLPVSTWEEPERERLQAVRDALQPLSDFIQERGNWSVVRMDSFEKLFVDEYRV